MRLRAVLNDRKYTRTFALLALLLFAGAFFLHHMASQKEEEARALSAEADRIRQFAAGPRRPSSLPFLENLFRSTSSGAPMPIPWLPPWKKGASRWTECGKNRRKGTAVIFIFFIFPEPVPMHKSCRPLI